MKVAIWFLVLLFCSSCASIVSESVYPVRIDTNPSGVRYEVQDQLGFTVTNGRTPAVIPLEASDGFFSRGKYKLLCYAENGEVATTTPILAKLDPWYFGNILFGGPIGFLIVDPATGAMWKLPQNMVINMPATAKIPVAPAPKEEKKQ